MFRQRLASRWLVVILMGFILSGCSHLFLYPDHENYFANAKNFIEYEEGKLPTPDGEQLHYWYVPAQVNQVREPHPKGLVIVAHGNGQNLTSHIRGVGWLTAAGYNVAIFDYRGYGQSTGRRNLTGALHDTATALDGLIAKYDSEPLPVFFYGLSLGGTLLLKTVSSHPRHWSPRMVIIESSFYSYVDIAREKLADHWLTWPFQWLAYLVLSDEHSLRDEELKSISPVPVVQFHSETDPIVPISEGERIHHGLSEPKTFYRLQAPGHIMAMWIEKGRWREVLLKAMANASSTQK